LLATKPQKKKNIKKPNKRVQTNTQASYINQRCLARVHNTNNNKAAIGVPIVGQTLAKDSRGGARVLVATIPFAPNVMLSVDRGLVRVMSDNYFSPFFAFAFSTKKTPNASCFVTPQYRRIVCFFNHCILSGLTL
jgi:hypothetical protein